MSKKHQRCRFIWYIITWYYDNKKLFQLESLYSTAFTVDGTRSHHSFVAQGNGSLIMNVFPLIGAMTNMNFTTSIYTITASTKKLVEMSLVYVGIILDVEIRIKIATLNLWNGWNLWNLNLHWISDTHFHFCWVTFKILISFVDPTKPVSSTERQYTLIKYDFVSFCLSDRVSNTNLSIIRIKREKCLFL